ncbi:MAG: hypothetical protein L7H18_01505 [Candidatus Nealsonbacteria bacterium DGGOD1a]|jgi:hypothetical protein|nr:MAG: hypothetical protein L7H18_01505 [Candidatus Nealsonbacteria bacterium DGGOD1a]
MEDQKPVNNQKISGLRKPVYLIIGIIFGALVWFAAGYLLLTLSSYVFYFNYVFPIFLVDMLIVAVLVWSLPRAMKKKFIIIGMLLFFAAVFLIPGPCSIFSFLSEL